MARFYSAARGGFFDESIHGARGAKGSKIPKDAVEVAQADYEALLAEQAAGKSILAVNGAPVAGVRVATAEELLASVRRQRDRDLGKTDWTQAGDALNATQRKSYAAYRQQLRDLPKKVEEAIAAGTDPKTVPYPRPPALQRPAPRSGGGVTAIQ